MLLPKTDRTVCAWSFNLRRDKFVILGGRREVFYALTRCYFNWGTEVLTSTWEAGFAKILIQDVVLEKKKRYSGQRWRKVGTRDCSEKGTGRWDQDSPLFTLFPDPDWVELMEGMEFNLCRIKTGKMCLKSVEPRNHFKWHKQELRGFCTGVWSPGTKAKFKFKRRF